MLLPFPRSRQVSRNSNASIRCGSTASTITTQSHWKALQRYHLVVADSDFIPAMKFARREGAQLFLITLAHGIKVGMREHADLVIDQDPF